MEEWKEADLQQVFAALAINELAEKFQSGLPFESEVRLKRKDGQYRWFHYRLSPMSVARSAGRAGRGWPRSSTKTTRLSG